MIGQHMIILHIGSWRFWLFIVTSPCNVMGRFSSSPSAMSTTSPSSAFLIKGTPMKLCFIYRGLVIGTKGFSVPCDLVRPKRAHLAMIITSHLANSLLKKSRPKCVEKKPDVSCLRIHQNHPKSNIFGHPNVSNPCSCPIKSLRNPRFPLDNIWWHYISRC